MPTVPSTLTSYSVWSIGLERENELPVNLNSLEAEGMQGQAKLI